jgi:hypothetical protein
MGQLAEPVAASARPIRPPSLLLLRSCRPAVLSKKSSALGVDLLDGAGIFACLPSIWQSACTTNLSAEPTIFYHLNFGLIPLSAMAMHPELIEGYSPAGTDVGRLP